MLSAALLEVPAMKSVLGERDFVPERFTAQLRGDALPMELALVVVSPSTVRIP